MGLPVSETSSKEAFERRDAAEVVVVKSTIGRDGMSPHQIPHTEIVEGLIEREVGTGMLKDMLRGGIWSSAVLDMVPGAGGSPPDMGIGVNSTLVRRRSTIVPTRDTGVVAPVLLGIRHWGQGVVSWTGTLQIHCKEMDKVPSQYPPVHPKFIQNFPSQFPCSVPRSVNGQYIHSVPGHVTVISPLGTPWEHFEISQRK